MMIQLQQGFGGGEALTLRFWQRGFITDESLVAAMSCHVGVTSPLMLQR